MDCLFIYWVVGVLYISWIPTFFSDVYVCKFFFLPICSLPINFLNDVLQWQKLLIPKSISIFCLMIILCPVQENLAYLYSPPIYSMFFSRSFLILIFSFRSIIHIKLMFVCGMKVRLSWAFSHVNIQLFQHHLLKNNFLLQWIVLVPWLELR